MAYVPSVHMPPPQKTDCFRLWHNAKRSRFTSVFKCVSNSDFFPPCLAYSALLLQPSSFCLHVLPSCQREFTEPSKRMWYLHSIFWTRPDLYFFDLLKACVTLQPQ